MNLFELVFILLFLGSVVSLFLSLILIRRRGSRKIVVTLAWVWSIYLVILAVTDVFSSQKVFKVGEDQCFDEMCFAVVGAQTMPQSVRAADPTANKLYAVTVRVTSHSRGRAQSEGGLHARLYSGTTYIDVSESAQKAYDAQHEANSKLTQRIAPGASILSVLIFEVPPGIEHPALVLDHGFTPGYFVIGESPWFHKPDIHLLLQDQQ
jgi:hypothetical protein